MTAVNFTVATLFPLFDAKKKTAMTKIIGNIPVFSMFAMPSNYINGVTSFLEVLISLVI